MTLHAKFKWFLSYYKWYIEIFLIGGTVHSLCVWFLHYLMFWAHGRFLRITCALIKSAGILITTQNIVSLFFSTLCWAHISGYIEGCDISWILHWNLKKNKGGGRSYISQLRIHIWKFCKQRQHCVWFLRHLVLYWICCKISPALICPEVMRLN